MITPYAIRLRIGSVDSSGATVGRLYALSTVGSIAGTFLGGFILISFFGSTAILWGVAACMLGLSLGNGGGRGRLRLTLLAVCGLMAALSVGYDRWSAAAGLNRLVESPYNSIRVFDGVDWARNGRAVRLMATDPGYSQSGMRAAFLVEKQIPADVLPEVVPPGLAPYGQDDQLARIAVAPDYPIYIAQNGGNDQHEARCKVGHAVAPARCKGR